MKVISVVVLQRKVMEYGKEGLPTISGNFLPVDRKYYLCGSAEMVVGTRDILISKNVPYDAIIAEIYF